ncbi:MAG: DUF1800 domain-containing protein [Phycisphaerales bacterium]|nr:DUF1800 domain-containing protein [Phycisphaerales bacterium]MCI0674908.1 DUF1800 domain-containing protein [Phycisphaerales bacterium]
MRTSRRTFVQSVGFAGLSAALTGCESASDALAHLLAIEEGADFRPPDSDQIDDVSHAINRLTYGPRPGDYRRVAALGLDACIAQQLDPLSIDDRRCEWRVASIESLNQPAPELYDYPPQQLLFDLTRARILRAVYSKRQLYEIMVEFWTDHFNIVSDKGECKWVKAADDRDVIRRHALGKFRDLVRASAVSPAMLIYLDGHDNKVEHPEDRPNENYARELLELHTLGVHGGYTQKDVMEVARCLSGWTYGHYFLRFKQAHVEFNSARHENGEKTVLGQHIPAGGGADDLERVLDIVCGHPSTAMFIATKLCRRFIDDPPPQSAVEAAAQEFEASGGDIKRVLQSLFDSDEFRSQTVRGKLFKRPMHFIASALRATNAKSHAGEPVIDSLRRMGHAPFQYPTPDGYPLEEQPWLGTLLWRWNFALALQAGQLQDTSVDLSKLTRDFGSAASVAAHLLGRRPTQMEQQILNETNAPLAVMLASPAFQRF